MRLIAEEVSYAYPGALPLYERVSHRWHSGSLNAIVGPSGSGKSTFLDLLGGIRRASAGEVHAYAEIDGVVTTLNPSDHRAACSWILQSNTVISGRSVLENVTLPLILQGWSRSDASAWGIDILANLGMHELRNDIVNTISGGEQQRVTIARCLASPSSIILADEPSGNLDLANTLLVADALRAAADRGKIVIVATHDPEIANASDSTLEFRKSVSGE